jgi:hypothetical protein
MPVAHSSTEIILLDVECSQFINFHQLFNIIIRFQLISLQVLQWIWSSNETFNRAHLIGASRLADRGFKLNCPAAPEFISAPSQLSCDACGFRCRSVLTRAFNCILKLPFRSHLVLMFDVQ